MAPKVKTDKKFWRGLYFSQDLCYNCFNQDKQPKLILQRRINRFTSAVRKTYLKECEDLAKLYFKYGAMGSSKTAQALITKFNYEERGMRVWLIKPAIETRDGEYVRSRIGLEAKAELIDKNCDIKALFDRKTDSPDVIIADECQFFTSTQIDELRAIVDEKSIPVLAFGLRTDFRTELFDGSKRLFELADSISEIKTICACGKKATVNARLDQNGNVLTKGAQLLLGGNESYTALCHSCYRKRIKEYV